MFRSEVLWTVALLTTGLVGGAVYNWPSMRDSPQSVQQSDPTQMGPQSAPSNDDSTRGFSPIESPPRQPTDVDGASRNEAETSSAMDVPNALAAFSSPVTPSAYGTNATADTGDNLLTGGNYLGAYQKYSDLARRNGNAPDSSLLIRLGLAAEFANLFEQSETHYRQAIESSSSNTAQRLWGLIGTARIWEKTGRIDEAIGLLSELYLVYGGEAYPDDFRHPIHKQLTDCLIRQYKNTAKDDPEAPEDFGLRQYWDPVVIENILGIEDGNEGAAKTYAFPPDVQMPTLNLLTRAGADVSLVQVQASMPLRPITQLMGEIGHKAQIDFQISARARKELTGRSTRLVTEGMPVPVILDHAFGALPVGWIVKDGVVYVMQFNEMATEQRYRYQLQKIRRLLRQRKNNFNNDAEKIASNIEDGNISLVLGELEEAGNQYDSALVAWPGGELGATLYYNYGILSLLQNDKANALGKFYQALDQSMDPSLRGASQTRIAELEFEFGRMERAIQAASHGRRMTTDPEVIAQNIMLLAKAYLVNSDPYSCNLLLFENSKEILDPRLRRLGSVLSSYSRFLIVQPAEGLQNEGERLVRSLAAITPSDANGFADHLILSRAYAAVGFRNQSLSHLKSASELATTSHWRKTLELDLAERLFHAGDAGGARKNLQSMDFEPDDGFYERGKKLAAQAAFELEQFEECRQICDELLIDAKLDADSKRETLELLGRAYQGLGLHYTAAFCFAGQHPKSGASGE